MAKREKLSKEAIDAFVAKGQGWKREGEALEKSFSFKYWGSTIGFVVHLGFAAEKRDHHPDLAVRWGQVTVRWSTHDSGGITATDVEMAEMTDHVYLNAR